MEFLKTSNNYSLKKSTYVNLRWTAYLGQLIAILSVKFFFKFDFNYIFCIAILLLSVLTNFYLEFKIKENQLNNNIASIFLGFDILQLGCLFYLTGGITNPFIFLIIIPAVFSSQYLSLSSSAILVFITTIILFILSFFYQKLPGPDFMHFHVPHYFLYSIPVSIFIGLVYLVYFGVKFGAESKIRQEAFDKLQEIMAKENELLSLGGQAAAAAHSLGTPLSTILLTVKEIKKEFKGNIKIEKDIDLIISQSNRCREILKKLSLNPIVDDEFVDSEATFKDYINEIIRSYEEISKKKFIFNTTGFKKPIKIFKSVEIIYGLRNFIGNANKFSKEIIQISLKNIKDTTEIVIMDDGPGFPKDLIDKHKLGEPYIRTTDNTNVSKYGLGLGTFIGKTLLEKNFAKIKFDNLEKNGGAKVSIIWNNNDLKKV